LGISGRTAGSRSFARPSSRGNVARSGVRGGNRSFVVRNTNRIAAPNVLRNANGRASAVRNAMNSRSVAGALHNRSALHDPGARNRILASAAAGGRHFGRGDGGGWWRHRGGGYGWVGPLFWPFAYYDFYDYALWGDYDDSFWGYGYDDIYAGIFSPYGYDDLIGYMPPQPNAGQAYSAGQTAPARRAAANAASNQLAPMCGEDSDEIAGLPIDKFRQAIQPNEEQSAALDDLAKASAQAARNIKAACPTQISLTALNRLGKMENRIEAMIAAVDIVQPPLEKFYGLMNDEQKARLNALGKEQGQRRAAYAAGSLALNCGSAKAGVTDWPGDAVERAIHPTEAQRTSLAALQDAAAKAAEMLKACPSEHQLTPPARLAAVGERLDTMLQAVKTVHAALNDFYATLSDEQKAQFEALGPQRTAALDPAEAAPPARRRHVRGHSVSLRSILRRFGI
jgi:hypothetical protein